MMLRKGKEDGPLLLMLAVLSILYGCGGGGDEEEVATLPVPPPCEYLESIVPSCVNPPPLSESGIGEIRAQRPAAVFEQIDMAEFGRRWNAAAEHFGKSELAIDEYELRYDNYSMGFRHIAFGENGGYVYEDSMGGRHIEAVPTKHEEDYQYRGVENRLWALLAELCPETMRLCYAYVWWGVGEISGSRSGTELIPVLWRLFIYSTHAHVGLEDVDDVLDAIGLTDHDIVHPREWSRSVDTVEYAFISQHSDPHHPGGDGTLAVRPLLPEDAPSTGETSFQ